jgi:predicted RNase H-like nuclease (RuvC/YqgF family)
MSKRRNEIMAWLREEARVHESQEEPNEDYYEMLHEAANEIEELEEEREALRSRIIKLGAEVLRLTRENAMLCVRLSLEGENDG